MIVGLGAAAHLVTCHLAEYRSHLAGVRDYLRWAARWWEQVIRWPPREELIRHFHLVTGEEGRLEAGQVGGGAVLREDVILHNLWQRLTQP